LRVLAVDPGSKWVGLAISDETGLIAQPLGDAPAEPADTLAQRLVEKARALGVADVVVGLPVRLDGSQGPEAKAARELAGQLRASGLRVDLMDERLTSAAAERALLETGMRRERRKRMAHRVSAALILQSYLDKTRSGRRA
jgi:putative Holliday junction resolvase